MAAPIAPLPHAWPPVDQCSVYGPEADVVHVPLADLAPGWNVLLVGDSSPTKLFAALTR